MHKFSELDQLEGLLEQHSEAFAQIRELTRVQVGEKTLPVYGMVLGNPDPTLPTYGIFGGVHGLEKIGTHVAHHYLEILLKQLKWDSELQNRLTRCRIVSIPLINPGGMHMLRRSNPNGVDLMRNAPVEALAKTPFLVGGHRHGSWLPWYRGKEGAPMEPESQALVDFVQREMFQSKFCISLDLHSGFGMRDRFWYPYAKTATPFGHITQAEQVRSLLEEGYPNHIYIVEPQSKSYTTNGDLWDYLYDAYVERNPEGVYLPFTLEMGSWVWVKKNPKQMLSLLGPFNPIMDHRYRRTLRRHMFLLDFLHRLTVNHNHWCDQRSLNREAMRSSMV